MRVIEGKRIPAIAMATTINLSYIFFIFIYTLFAIEEYFTRNPFPATPFPLLPYRPNWLGMPSHPPGIVPRVFSPPQAQQ